MSIQNVITAPTALVFFNRPEPLTQTFADVREENPVTILQRVNDRRRQNREVMRRDGIES